MNSPVSELNSPKITILATRAADKITKRLTMNTHKAILTPLCVNQNHNFVINSYLSRALEIIQVKKREVERIGFFHMYNFWLN
jgi:hypothetical protein